MVSGTVNQMTKPGAAFTRATDMPPSPSVSTSFPQGAATTGQRAQLVALLVLLTCLSQFYRVSNSVIAPELSRDLGLTATDLGWAGAVFFLALLVMQIPVGLMFDRIGARRTVSGLSLIAVLGAVLLARADGPASHLLARTVVGVGCAASFMSAVFLVSRWFPPARLSTSLSWVFAASNVGTLMAATPLAYASATIGWRNGFLLLGAVTAVAAVLFYLLVRDVPPGMTPPGNATETAGAVLRGLLEVWKTPGLGPVLAMHTFAYAVMLTVLGVWAGPYLHAVHGLESIARGHVMLGMGLAQIIGILGYGPLDRLFGSRKKVVVAGVLTTTLVLVALAALDRPPLWLAVSLLVALTFFAAYGIVIVAQGRSLFPAHLAGRGVTTVNMAQVLGCMALPAASGYVVGGLAAPDGSTPEIAFRAVFGLLAVCNLVGLAAYMRSPDSRPV
jgi:predicted MFS family arabinose efflux permease